MSRCVSFLPALVAAAALVAVAGCTDPANIANDPAGGGGSAGGDGPGAGSGGGSTCSGATGGAEADAGGGGKCSYPWVMVSPDLEKTVAPSCGVLPGDPLPCGACCGEGSMCQAGHNRECPGTTPGDPQVPWSPYDGWLCVCTAGMWDCKVQSPAAAICPPPPGDAGAGD